MILVLKRGNPMQTKCKECKSELQYEYSDIKKDIRYEIGYCGDHEYTYKYIKCPICGEEVDVR